MTIHSSAQPAAKPRPRPRSSISIQIVVDREAEGGLELVQALQSLGELFHLGDCVFLLERTDETVALLRIQRHPQAVLKTETL